MSASHTTSAGKTGGSIGSSETSEPDPRTATLKIVVASADLDDTAQQQIIGFAVAAINKYVYMPTRKAANHEDVVDRPLLEREVERTAMSHMSRFIKEAVDSTLGGTWHVIYGRSYATYVTHERMSFFHCQINEADIVVWKHG